MTPALHRALLPAGLHDLLPPVAGHEAVVIERLMAIFAAWGYQRVKPPLIEFEDNLLAGGGKALSPETFRVLDPASQRMMGVRADITPQVARIAHSRLRFSARPLRLAYAGQVLRVKGTQLRPERQFAQVGAELIGVDRAEADAELVLLIAEGLDALRVPGVSIDLCMPTLVPTLCRLHAVEPLPLDHLRHAVDRKDSAAVKQLGGPLAGVLEQLMAAAGPADRAIHHLTELDLPPEAARQRDHLFSVVRLIRAATNRLELTIDPVERRGFEYQTGVSFTVFARGVRGELGRGGRYRTDTTADTSVDSEPATGFTLYSDSLLRAVRPPEQPPRVYVPHGQMPDAAAALRRQGWVTVCALAPVDDVAEAARRLDCTHCLNDGEPRPLRTGTPT